MGEKGLNFWWIDQHRGQKPPTHLSEPWISRFFFLISCFPPERLSTPSRGRQSQFSSFPLISLPSLAPNPPFSLQIHPQASADTKMEDWGRETGDGELEGGLKLSRTPAPCHCPPHPPGPTLAVSSSSSGLSPRVRRWTLDTDPQTCRGSEWGSRGRCSRAPGVHPPPPVPFSAPAPPHPGHPSPLGVHRIPAGTRG